MLFVLLFTHSVGLYHTWLTTSSVCVYVKYWNTHVYLSLIRYQLLIHAIRSIADLRSLRLSS